MAGVQIQGRQGAYEGMWMGVKMTEVIPAALLQIQSISHWEGHFTSAPQYCPQVKSFSLGGIVRSIIAFQVKHFKITTALIAFPFPGVLLRGTQNV